jgi:amino acid transporter
MLSPAIGLYGNWGPSFLAAGSSAPLAFLLGLVATLPTAVSYALLSREHPDSGSAASWAARAGGPGVGRWAGWIVFVYYFINFILQPVTAGVFLNDLAAMTGLPSGPLVFSLGAILACIWPALAAYRGISPSTKGALAFLTFETAVVTALCATVYFCAPRAAGSFSAAAFRLPAGAAGLHGLASAMVFSVLTFSGFDVISTLSEEAKMPRRLIPQATFLSLAVFGAGMIGGVWILSSADSAERLRAVAASGAMPINEIARGYWGRAALLVPLTAISAALGIAIATAVGASRILYSMGRAGRAPRWLSRLHPEHLVPWNAMHLIFSVGLAAALLTGTVLGPYGAYVWWGTTSTFFALTTYLLVNAANLVLFRARARRSWSGFLLHALLPAVGIVIDGVILGRSCLYEGWLQGSAGRAAVLFELACAAAALAAALSGARTKVLGEEGPVGELTESPDSI